MHIRSAGSGKAVAELLVQPEHTNRGGTLHGGFVATLVDSVTTIALMSDESADSLMPGVSLDLSVLFISPGGLGRTIEMQAETLKRGKTIAYLTMDILDKESRRLIARGTHTKFLGSASRSKL